MLSDENSQYIDRESLLQALHDLKGTADHLLKIWLTLKHMGMKSGHPVTIDTGNSMPSLQALFGCGDPDGRFYVPFAHTMRYMTMAGDASRSIIQTTIRRWLTSGSVVTVDPTAFLSIEEDADGQLLVRPGRAYPEGLGFGKNGFALKNNLRVALPLRAFGAWFCRQTPIPASVDVGAFVVAQLAEQLNLTLVERQMIFTDDPERTIKTSPTPIADEELYNLCQSVLNSKEVDQYVVHQSYDDYIMEVRSMTTPTLGRPEWLTGDPANLLRETLDSGAKAVLLYGPPRTGKTRIVNEVLSGKQGERIQIHNGWGYSELVIGLKPTGDGRWDYQRGPLLNAIRRGRDYVVLEEINRTDFSQAIGEVFSLIEEAYRGNDHTVTLQDNSQLSIPESLVFLFTMNTLDRSTENIDDALFGRMAAVEFPPRVEVLSEMLEENDVPNAQQWRKLFAVIQQYHPIGHGYFASLNVSSDPVVFYRTRLRPVLQKHLAGYRDDELQAVDEKFNELFG